MLKPSAMALTVLQPVFDLDGVMFLPHYSKKHTWVSPAFEYVYTTTQLVELGAEKRTEHLWPRSWTEEVT